MTKATKLDAEIGEKNPRQSSNQKKDLNLGLEKILENLANSFKTMKLGCIGFRQVVFTLLRAL